MEKKHPEKYRGQTYKCTICNYETNLKFQLKKHITAHKSCNESHMCKICKKKKKTINVQKNPCHAHFNPFKNYKKTQMCIVFLYNNE